MPMKLPTKDLKKEENPNFLPNVTKQMFPVSNDIKDLKPKQQDQEVKERQKRLNLDELLLSLNIDSLIEYCLKNPSLKHFSFLKYMLPDNYLPMKVDIPGLGSKTISKRGGGGFSGAVTITIELVKEVLKEKEKNERRK